MITFGDEREQAGKRPQRVRKAQVFQVMILGLATLGWYLVAGLS